VEKNKGGGGPGDAGMNSSGRELHKKKRKGKGNKERKGGKA